MKVAVLVLAARAPMGLERLARLLGPELFRFHVHVDAKVEAGLFGGLAGADHVQFLPARLPVFWGGFSMVEAEIALLRAALAEGTCDRFVLISDDSFTLRNPAALHEALRQDVVRIVHNPVGPPLRQRYDGFYFFDSDATSAQHRPPAQRFLTGRDLDAIRRLAALRARGKAPLATLFHGPQWWSLTAEAARHVLDCYDSDPELRESFRYSAIPDEQYVQTLIGREPGRWRTGPCPVYSDFSGPVQPRVFTTIEEVRPAYATPALFIRKVAQDEALLDAMAVMAARTAPPAQLPDDGRNT